MTKFLFFTIAIIPLWGCASLPSLHPALKGEQKVSVLTFNVENLFDTEDDPEKMDETYLPLSVKSSPVYQNKCRIQNDSPSRIQECLHTDWTPALLERKLQRLTDVVAQVQGGLGPDILILEEVESRAVLEQWRNKYLKAMGYETLAFVKGPDERGINPAILTRLPMLNEPTLHTVDLSIVEDKARPTRGILEARLQMPNGEKLHVFALHFPSQASPTAFRRQAVQTLKDLTTTLPADANVLVGGDFNITTKEELKENFFANTLGQDFAVSHLSGCEKCVGTVYYPPDQTWSFFDVLLFSRNLDGGPANWQLDRHSIRVVNSSIYQMKADATPARFGNGRGPVGVSDHWPVYAELYLKPRKQLGVAL